MSNDNTKSNEYSQKILEAMDIIAQSKINSISFDKTITCTIKNDEKRKEGEYEVSDGSTKFKAYSTDDGYRKDDVVYVTIPQGDYNNQKLIVSKKTDDIAQPMIFKMPFDNIFDMTGNLAAADGQSLQAGMLLANDVQVNAEGEVVLENDLPNKIQGGTTVHLGTLTPNLSNFTRFGVRADFKTWLAEAVEGTYGLKFEITTQTQGTVDSTSNNNQATNTSKEDFYFTNIADMYGNTYNYESYYSQEKVFTLTNQGKITQIDVYFFQLGDFKDKNKQDIKATDSFNSRLWENIYVDNLYLCLGYDIAVFNDDYVEIYTENSSDYAISRDTADTKDSIDSRNTKNIEMRWVHIDDNGDPVDMSKVEKFDKPTEIRWYRYRIGAAAADNYSGIYWERIESASGMSYDFIPNVNNQQEKIKAVVLYNYTEKDETTNTLESGIPYHSNELEFTNQETLPPGETAQHIANALQIITNDGSNGNYLIYGQDNSIKDTKYGDEIRTLSCVFDTNNDGKYESEVESVNLTWHFPTSNTMIEFINGGVSYTPINLIAFNKTEVYEKDSNDENKYNLTTDTEFLINKTYYKKIDENNYEEIQNPYIKNTYYKQNYIQATSYDNKRIYYERSGASEPYTYTQSNEVDISNFTNYYILDYILSDDYNLNDKYFKREQSNSTITGRPQYKIKKYYSPNYTNNTITCQYNLNGVIYNSEIEFTFGPSGTMGTDQTLVVDFVGDTNAIDLNSKTTITAYPMIVRVYDKENKELSNVENITWSWYYQDVNRGLTLGNSTEQICTINVNSNLAHGQLYIIKVKVGDLETYYPIALKSGNVSYIEGPTQIIYMSDGTINYQNVPYKVFKADKSEIISNWTIIDTSSQSAFSYKRIVLTQSTYVKEKYYIKNDDGTFSPSSNDFNAKTPYYQKIYAYIGNLENGNKLKPLGIYVENAPIYGVRCGNYWTQPILVLQNRWGNNVLNKWDGEQLIIDESNGLILANAISAGKKERDNSFTGVIIGDWGKQDADASITKNTGVYGFHEGGMCYAFKDNGEAFIGKDGKGRIYLNGDDGTIESAKWVTSNSSSKTGMCIDLKNNSITMKGEVSSLFMDPSQVTLVGGTISGSTISTGLLTSPIGSSTSSPIELEGAFRIDFGQHALNNETEKYYYGYFGQLDSNLYTNSSDQEQGEVPGVGLYVTDDDLATKTSTKISGIKSTLKNVGLFYDGGGYLSISKDGLAVGSTSLNLYASNSGTTTAGKINLTSTHIGLWYSDSGYINLGRWNEGTKEKPDYKYGFLYNGEDVSTNELKITGCKVKFVGITADNQEGIYARFA